MWGALWEHFELGHPSPRHSDVIALQMCTRSVQTLNWDTAYVTRLAWERLGILPEELEEVSREREVWVSLCNRCE